SFQAVAGGVDPGNENTCDPNNWGQRPRLKLWLSSFGKRPSLVKDHGISVGLRARGSRSLVVAVLGEVTNGPPSRGAAEENAMSGMSLGKPSNGNSFRSGK